MISRALILSIWLCGEKTGLMAVDKRMDIEVIKFCVGDLLRRLFQVVGSRIQGAQSQSMRNPTEWELRRLNLLTLDSSKWSHWEIKIELDMTCWIRNSFSNDSNTIWAKQGKSLNLSDAVFPFRNFGRLRLSFIESIKHHLESSPMRRYELSFPFPFLSLVEILATAWILAFVLMAKQHQY